MSEEVQETVNPDVSEVDETDSLDESDLSIEDYKKIVSKLRKEAGSRRIKGKEAEEKLKEYDDWKKSQMSEVDRVKAEKSEMEAELKEYRKTKAAQKAELDLEFADLVVGESEEEMVKSAKALKARLDGKGNVRDTMRPGGRGGPVESSAADKNAWFRSLFDQ